MRAFPYPAVAAAFFVFLPALFAQEELPGKKGKEEEEVTITLQNVDMADLIEIVQRETGKLFLSDTQLQRQKITFKGGVPIPRKALYSVFKSILETRHYGITEMEVDGMTICKIAQVRQTFTGPSETFAGEDVKANPEILPQDDTMVTVVYALQYAEARATANQLRQIVNQAQGGNILGIPNVNVVVVTAFGSVMQRLIRIIDLMDVPGPQVEWKVVRLLYAEPDVVASKIESILQTRHQQSQARQLQAQPPGKLVPEPRTRSLIIQALPDQFPEILSLIKKLDQKLDEEPSMVHVVRLKHTNAEDMEQIVNAIIQANPDLGMVQEEGESPIPLPRGAGEAASRLAPARRTPRAPRRIPPASGEEERAAAIADTATNSLIIVAPEAYFRELEAIIDSLDLRRPQVLIEAMIVEISSARGLDLGAELAVLDKAAEGSTRGFGATAFGLSNIVDQDGNPIDFSSGTSEGAVNGIGGRLPTFSSQGMQFGILAGKNYKIPLLLSLLGSESDVNVLFLPRILTNENETAEIQVLEEVPTAQSQSTAAVTNSLTFGGFENAGITLTITPHISENESLRMEIEQNIEQFTGTSTVLGGGGVVLPPSKTSREITNEVTVPNHKTVVLGGLTSTTRRTTTSKIPLLGDIPILGALFRHQQSDIKKTNLFVFITPHILSDARFRDLERISDEALKEARASVGEEKRYGTPTPGRGVSLMEYRPAVKE